MSEVLFDDAPALPADEGFGEHCAVPEGDPFAVLDGLRFPEQHTVTYDDGSVETFHDLDADGDAELVEYDHDGDGRPEGAEIDSNGDGRYDRAAWDPDHD